MIAPSERKNGGVFHSVGCCSVTAYNYFTFSDGLIIGTHRNRSTAIVKDSVAFAAVSFGAGGDGSDQRCVRQKSVYFSAHACVAVNNGYAGFFGSETCFFKSVYSGIQNEKSV